MNVAVVDTEVMTNQDAFFAGKNSGDESLTIINSQIAATFDTSAASPVTVTSVEYQIDNANSWETNIYVNTTEYFMDLEVRKSFTKTAYSTCTTTPLRTNITYEIIKNGIELFPDWVSLNTTSGEYEGIAPILKSSTKYSFILNSSWTTNPSGDSQQRVEITVNPFSASGTAAAAIISSQMAALLGGA